MGRLDVDAMLSEMSSPQLSEWVAFLDLHIPDIEINGASIQATLCNVMGSGKRVFRPSDFIRQRMPTPEMESDEIFAGLMGIVPDEE